MIKKQIKDRTLNKHLSSLSKDTREVFILENNNFRATIISATHLLNGMRANHNR